MLGLVSKWSYKKIRSKYFIPSKLGGPLPNMAVSHQFMHIQLAVFDLVFQQQEKPCENEIHGIMFSYYQSQSTDIHFN